MKDAGHGTLFRKAAKGSDFLPINSASEARDDAQDCISEA
jgi:hypothetical protein